MPSLSPIALASLIIFVLAIIGLLVAYIRNAATFKGYEEVSPDARQIAKELKGEIFRDGADLVLSGNYNKLPCVVRFSYDEHTPGLNIRMRAPAAFTLSVAPKGAAEAAEGRVAVRTGDDMFDARFTTRTDQPNQVKMLFAGRQTLAGLAKLCCSSRTFFTMTSGNIELSELVIPSPYTGRHVVDHLGSMGRLAAALRQMPGAEAFKIQELKKEHSSPVLRLAIAMGVVAAVLAVVAATRPAAPSAAGSAVDVGSLPEGVLPVDAPLIAGINTPRNPGERVLYAAREQDFDPGAVSWLRGAGKEVSGRVPGDYAGNGKGQDVAYVLVRADGSRRVVLLVSRANRYDASYAFVGITARVPRSSVGNIKWVGSPPQGINGDGLLITRKPDDLASGLVFFTSADGRIVTGVPANYQNISLE